MSTDDKFQTWKTIWAKRLCIIIGVASLFTLICLIVYMAVYPTSFSGWRLLTMLLAMMGTIIPFQLYPDILWYERHGTQRVTNTLSAGHVPKCNCKRSGIHGRSPG
ncbi:MAG: hypothetical protein ACI9TY_000760 [Alphaproteobacteria bacterium]|jgi:hypothetical protein